MISPVGMFFYGSVLDAGEMRVMLDLQRPVEEGVDFVRASLHGWRQTWNVCTDNDGPQRTHYLDPATSERPPIQVLFLNIDPVPGASTAGAVVMVNPGALDRFDQREANYTRHDVTAAVAADLPLPKRIYAYVGRPEKVARAQQAIADGTARIWDVYMGRVTRGLSAFGLAPDLSMVDTVPVVALTRVTD